MTFVLGFLALIVILAAGGLAAFAIAYPFALMGKRIDDRILIHRRLGI
jgi:hypothetical protein